MKLHTYLARINFIKTLKIAFGCIFAYLLAEFFGLSYSTSVITITLLSILNTRKETLKTAWKRILAFCFSVLTALLLFPLLRYSPFSIFLYLLIYYPVCQIGKFTEGFSMSTVLILHLWKEQSVSFDAIQNEACLMALGIFMGFFMNLYMPDRTHLIRTAQKEIERQFSDILHSMSEMIFHSEENKTITDTLEILRKTLTEAIAHAVYTENNKLFRDMSYYSLYLNMRKEQYELLKRIALNLPRLREPYMQTASVSSLLHMTAESINEYNNAEELLYTLSEMRTVFRSAPLPQSRAEFESRAVLYEIVNELQEMLLLKLKFSEDLTPYQIKTFWNRKTS